MNKKGQIDFGIIMFIGIVIVLLIMAPILLRLVKEPVEAFSDAINDTDPTAAAAMLQVEGSFINLWDWVIIIAFLLNVILLLISAFLIDTHPFFVILYIIFCFLTIIFAPNILDTIEHINDAYPVESGTQLPMTQFIVDHFGTLILGLMILSGIIMYAKFKYFQYG